MKQITVLLLAAGIGSSDQAGNRTDTSLFTKSDSSAYQTDIRSKNGDLYLSIGGHVPPLLTYCPPLSVTPGGASAG